MYKLVTLFFLLPLIYSEEICRPFRKGGPPNLYTRLLPYHKSIIGSLVPCKTENITYNDPEPLGDFEQGKHTAFCQQWVLPQSPREVDPEFWMYTPELGAKVNQTVNFFDLRSSLQTLQFDSNRDFWVIVHGFGDDWPKTWMFPMKDALVAKGHNVMICRWTKGSKAPDYFQATANTRIMGAMIARIVTVMLDVNHVTLSQTTIVGFSLGAHVAGFAGAKLGKGLKKIVGLDPAGPLFQGEEPEASLDPDDAGFVMCLHTNGEPLECGGAGTMQQMGHIDFYANGGQVQPPCPPGVPMAIGDILHFDFSGIMNTLTCSHSRAPWLFTTSVILAGNHRSACKFNSYKCESDEDWNNGHCFMCDGSCPIAGYETEANTPFDGMFMFGTRPAENGLYPYCGSEFDVHLLPNKDAKGKIMVQLHFETGYISHGFIFHHSKEILHKEVSVARIMPTEFISGNPTAITIYYERYGSWFFEDGTDSFTLDDIVVITNRNTPLYVDGPAVINNKISATMPLNINHDRYNKINQKI